MKSYVQHRLGNFIEVDYTQTTQELIYQGLLPTCEPHYTVNGGGIQQICYEAFNVFNGCYGFLS